VSSPIPYDRLAEELGRQGYFADEALLTALFLAMELGKPLLLEGAPGVGKTQVAKKLAAVLNRECIRLQCYEGIDATKALYDWDHARQLLHVRVTERGGALETKDLFSPDFMIEMPLMRALKNAETSVLLIDEIDRADDAFEALLLEFLSDHQISIPEIGSVKAQQPVITILTSNRTRELHDALRRRCLYHWIDYPDIVRERAIVERHAPGLGSEAAQRLVDSMAGIRRLPLAKKPSPAESIDWAQAALVLTRQGIEWPEALRRSIGLIAKDPDDVKILQSAGML
jgi:MoxR-like ATPase